MQFHLFPFRLLLCHIFPFCLLRNIACRNLGGSQLFSIVKRRLTKQFKSFWRHENRKQIQDGKLDIYFDLKTDFCTELYLNDTTFSFAESYIQIENYYCLTHYLLIETLHIIS